MDTNYEIDLAGKDDIDAVLDLQERNLAHRGGTLSARFSQAWFETAIAAMPVIVTRRAGQVVGYLVSPPLPTYTGVPVVQAMLQAYRGASDAYVYGPICVEETGRGRGVAGAMFAALRARLPGREGVLFIRRDNAASLRSHTKMGMSEVVEFKHNDKDFAALSYVG
jgi:L-amino acid N-acyltransferase YncA